MFHRKGSKCLCKLLNRFSPERNLRIARAEKYLHFRPAHKKPFCQPHDLVGETTITKQTNISKLAAKMVSSGYEPRNCIVSAGKRVAIIVPFRDDGSKGIVKRSDLNSSSWTQYFLERFNHLKLLLHHMIPILIRQNIKFKFFLISQTPRFLFNRGKLLNAGFEEVAKRKVRAPWKILFMHRNQTEIDQLSLELSIWLLYISWRWFNFAKWLWSLPLWK